jgi:hypothetical protein
VDVVTLVVLQGLFKTLSLPESPAQAIFRGIIERIEAKRCPVLLNRLVVQSGVRQLRSENLVGLAVVRIERDRFPKIGNRIYDIERMKVVVERLPRTT